MLRKVLYISDRHKTYRDFDTIGNYREASQMVDEDLYNFVIKEKITDVVYGGDVYDGGYRSVSALYNDIYAEQKMSAAVNGNCYLCIGNHFFHERDSNPEMYLIQPGGRYTPKHPVPSIDKPVMQTPDTIIIGCVQFSLFHYDKDNKRYVQPRDPNVKWHVGFYHDDCVLPASVLKQMNMKSVVNSDYLRGIYANIDCAVVAHIHTPIGTSQVEVNGKTVPIIVPGAVTITDTKAESRHSTVDLPVFTITEDSCKISMHTFSTHSEVMLFRKKITNIAPHEIVPTIGGQLSEEVITRSLIPYLGAVDFLKQKAYDERGLKIFELAINGLLDMRQAVRILYKGV